MGKEKKRLVLLLNFIFFLQETYWTNDLLIQLEKEWGGRIILNPGTLHSKDTSVLFNYKAKLR